MYAKKRVIDGIEYMVLGTTVEYAAGLRVHRQSWTTTKGKVTYENGKYTHPEEQEPHNG